MSNPPPFIPGFSYTGYQAINPTRPLPGPMVDNDFADAADSIGQTITALAQIRRSDGQLANGIVTQESLASDLTIGVQTATAWVTARAYTVGNIVVQINKFYTCAIAHTSGVFATDLAALKWTEITLSITGYAADQVTYDNAVSGLAAVNVKTALDEIDARTETLVAFGAAQALTAAQQAVARTNVSAALRGHLWGLTLSNNAADAVNDIDIAVGEAASSETNPVMMSLVAAMGKRLDALWVAGGTPGSANGGLDTGAVADVTYHVYLIRNPTTLAVDAIFSTSATTPDATRIAGFTQTRRIGSFLRVGGSIVKFLQDGDTFWRETLAQDAAVNQGTAAVTRTLSVPLGIKVTANVMLAVTASAGVGSYTILTSLDLADVAPNVNLFQHALSQAAAVQQGSSAVSVRTNTLGQIRSRTSASGSGQTIYINTLGWTDTRGRLL